VSNDPDILVGYNIWKFDLAFIMDRAVKLGIENHINLNRIVSSSSQQYKAKFSSSAYGDNEYRMVRSIGRMQIDLLEVYKREHKLVKYSLNFVSEHFLKDAKVDMPVNELFDRFKRGTKADMTEIGRYCIKDTELPLRLMQKLNDIPNLMEMAKVTFVPMNYLIERGQQIKVFSQITKQTRLDDMLVITPKYGAPRPDSFVGATVLNAEKGAYMEEVVVGLDFASLYPTIMRAHNLCYNTIVLDERYANVEGVTYESVTIGTPESPTTVKFAQNKPGVLPRILEHLAVSRKKAKKDMAEAAQRGDTFMKDVFNGKQLAFKVSMNSIYGFCAAYMLPCQPISASVTTIGRQMIDKTKACVEAWYPGSRVIYGDTDSVMVIFKTTETDILRESFRLGMEAADRISKTFKYPIELEFEKCYWPYLLFSKKRYAGLMYTKPDAPDYIDAKGIQLVRRDNPDFVKQVSKRILNMIMYDRKIAEAMEYAVHSAKQLLNNEVPIESLILSKSMKNEHSYKNTNQPHLVVARKMNDRSPGSGPRSGDRVPYVFVQTNNPDDLQCERAEDPQYVKDNQLSLDTLYYLQRSLMSPVCSLFELFVDNPEEHLFGDLVRQFKPPKVLCVGVTLRGTPCTKKPTPGSSVCKLHLKQVT
jgi:DNA polymerase delta subunit 1